MYLKDYKECLRIQERTIKNYTFHYEAVQTWPLFLEAIEPERRYKKWNKANIERINERLKKTPGNITSCFISKDRYYGKGYELRVSYTEKQLEYNEVRYNTQWDYIDLIDLDGENIYHAVYTFIHAEQMRTTEYLKTPSLEELQAFYDDLEKLKEKHACFERALDLLGDRNVR